MQATKHTVAALALVILNELDGTDLLIEVLLGPGFHEIASLITEHAGFDDYNSLYICFDYVYHLVFKMLLIHFFSESVQYGICKLNVSLIFVLSRTENDGLLTGEGNSSL